MAKERWKGGSGLDGGDDEIENNDGYGGGWWLLRLLLLFTQSDCLHVPIDWGDVVAGEHARLAVAASFPPVGVRVVQDLNEVATSEAQLAFLLGVEVKECLYVRGVLLPKNDGRKKTKAMNYVCSRDRASN